MCVAFNKPVTIFETLPHKTVRIEVFSKGAFLLRHSLVPLTESYRRAALNRLAGHNLEAYSHQSFIIWLSFLLQN